MKMLPKGTNKYKTFRDIRVVLQSPNSQVDNGIKETIICTDKQNFCLGVEEIQSIREFASDDIITLKENYGKIDNVYGQLQNIISTLEIKIQSVIKSDEKEFINIYESFIQNVKKIVENYKKRAESKECKYRNDLLINSLAEEIKQLKVNNMELVKTSAKLRMKINKLKAENDSLNQERDYFEARLKEVKSENKALKTALNKSLPSDIKPNINGTISTPKKTDIRNKAVSFSEEVLEIAKLDKEEGLQHP